MEIARHLRIGVPDLTGWGIFHQIVTAVNINSSVTRSAAVIVLKVMNKY
jgi:hypothetical protein